jgi:hypothetical protein
MGTANPRTSPLAAKHGFFGAIKKGVERAFAYFLEDRVDFRLPPGLQIFVVESTRNAGGHLLNEASVKQACIPNELEWLGTLVERHVYDY